MENISSLIDAPENGMTLNIAAHQSFDKYKWCLVKQVCS
jgi:hypothetical protein